MPTPPQTIDPEVMPAGSALPLKFQLPQGMNGFAWGTLFGIAAAFAIFWIVKKKL